MLMFLSDIEARVKDFYKTYGKQCAIAFTAGFLLGIWLI